MRNIQVSEAIRIDIEATKDTDFLLTLQLPQPLDGGTVELNLAGMTDTVAWNGSISSDGKSIGFHAKYGQMSFHTGVYRYVISYTKGNSRINLFTGNFMFKPRL